mmetsp:Transcript_35832/g.40861  ORF Transcript_35832/g.40861 Transcript_35832/m.40861 type:complete len:88 (-) Transcript_35832:1769-2032(-)
MKIVHKAALLHHIYNQEESIQNLRNITDNCYSPKPHLVYCTYTSNLITCPSFVVSSRTYVAGFEALFKSIIGVGSRPAPGTPEGAGA